jgi:hypothetical protein
MPVSSQLRVPHPLRFSKGGNLERLRDEMFSVSAFSISRSRNLCANIIAKLVASLFEHREQPGGSPDLQLVCLTTIGVPRSSRPLQRAGTADICSKGYSHAARDQTLTIVNPRH